MEHAKEPHCGDALYPSVKSKHPINRPPPEHSPATDYIDHRELVAVVRAVHGPGDRFFLTRYREKNAGHLYWGRSAAQGDGEAFTVEDVENGQLQREVERLNRDDKLAVALTVGSFRGKKASENCVRLAALAIDIDDDNIKVLVPGCETPDEAAPAVIEALLRYGISPHAIVCSGRGLHVYVLIEPVDLDAPTMRAQVEDVWYRIGSIVGGATDRHDLASVFRLPGTVNRKYGGHRRTYILKAYTNFERRRYGFDELVAALAAVPPRKERRANSAVPVADETEREEPDADERHALEVACKADSVLSHRRELSRDGDPDKIDTDRSHNDSMYAGSLIECGASTTLIVSEIENSQKGRERGKAYALSTFSNTARMKLSVSEPHQACEIRIVESVEKAASLVEEEGKEGDVDGHPSACGSTSASRSSVLSIVPSRAGSGKTTAINNLLARIAPTTSKRIVYTGPFLAELLKSEQNIGTGAVKQGPTNAEELLRAMPTALRVGERSGSPRWTEEKVQTKVKSIEAFALNMVHPLDVQRERLGRISSPFAVTTMPARADLCLAAHDERTLKREPARCSKCAYTACRANKSPGGAKSYSKDARVNLVTHAGFLQRHLHRPDLDDFDVVICDEAPQWLFETKAIEIHARPPERGRVSSWEIPVLREVTNALDERQQACRDDDAVRAATLLDRLDGVRRDLVRRASAAWTRFKKSGASTEEERMFRTSRPLLNEEEYRDLRRLCWRYPNEDDEAEGSALRDALDVLHAFSGEDDLPLLSAYSFSGARGGTFTIVRPVERWTALLRRPNGDARRALVTDATSGMDPVYGLLGLNEEESPPTGRFPNTTIVLTSTKTASKRSVMWEDADALSGELVRAVDPHLAPTPGQKLLVITTEAVERNLQRALRAAKAERGLNWTFVTAHHNALRGRNDFRDCDAVYFTHPLRRPEIQYTALHAALCRYKGLPGQWARAEKWPSTDLIRYRSMACDLYQDAMRIILRSDPNARAHIFVPASEAPFVFRLARMLAGARFVLPDGTAVEPRPVYENGLAGGTNDEPTTVACEEPEDVVLVRQFMRARLYRLHVEGVTNLSDIQREAHAEAAVPSLAEIERCLVEVSPKRPASMSVCEDVAEKLLRQRFSNGKWEQMHALARDWRTASAAGRPRA